MRTLAWMARNTKLVAHKPATEPSPRRRLVIAERGAAGVEAALEDAAFEETILVADAPGSAPNDLPLRVATRIANLERQGKKLSSATLVLTGGREPEMAAAVRELVARTLLTHLKATGGGELILLASSSGELDALLALVEKLLRELETRSVTIRLQFRSGNTRRAQGSARERRAEVAA